MPYIVDLDKKCDKVYTLKVSPFGWIDNPIEVEYGTCMINRMDPMPSVCFRVKGTTHVWAIFERSLYQISKGDYVSYFTKKLEEFRLEFLVWVHDSRYWGLQWFREYYEMFKGRFYDFSEKEKEEFDQSREEFDSIQQKLDNFTIRKPT